MNEELRLQRNAGPDTRFDQGHKEALRGMIIAARERALAVALPDARIIAEELVSRADNIPEDTDMEARLMGSGLATLTFALLDPSILAQSDETYTHALARAFRAKDTGEKIQS